MNSSEPSSPPPAAPELPEKITDLRALTREQLGRLCVNAALTARGATPAIEYWAPGHWRKRREKVFDQVAGKALQRIGEGETAQTLVRVWVHELWPYPERLEPVLMARLEKEGQAIAAQAQADFARARERRRGGASGRWA